jgi:lipopolysaccharide/colanic/teichoic acid biosynthesis glycosyltransferase
MFIKFIFDKFASIIGLLLFIPLFLIIGFLIKIKMPGGPVFFKQKRVGKNGEIFTLYKFRSMIVDNSASTISILDEERITPFGAILRKYKLDELPELWNIVKGDMSFVGPRPDVPGYADLLTGYERRILDIKPGITCPASIKYSNEEEILSAQKNPLIYNDEVIYPDKVRINLNYINTWSFGLDLKIILFTIIRKKLKEPYFN